MKALTLTQPWATLVAIGAKRIETRSFRTNYRGPLAIHAAKRFPPMAQEICKESGFLLALSGETLPLGCVLATCDLVDVLPTEARICLPGVFDDYPELNSEQERAFGNYHEGRWAWVLGNVRRLGDPIPAKGALSLWEWPEAQRAETPVQRETEKS